MKAVVVSQFGDPSSLILTDMPDPQVAAGEVLIEAWYSGINFAEILVRQGIMPSARPPFVMGLEVVGKIAAIGDGVEGFALGQPVAAFVKSGYAELVSAPAKLTVPLDLAGKSVDLLQAAAVPCVGVTAYQLLAEVAQMRKGDTVFVQGAAGGVGSAAGQIAKALGAGRVIGAVGNEAKIAFAQNHGYDDVILRDGFEAALRKLTNNRGVDVFLEGISGAHLAQPQRLLAPLGRAVYFGDTQFISDTAAAIQPLRFGNCGIFGYSLGNLCTQAPHYWRPSAEALLGLIADGSVVLDDVEIFAPAEAVQAHAKLESGSSSGKLVIGWR